MRKLRELVTSNMPKNFEAYTALIGALLGGSGLKLIEWWLNRAKTKDDSAKDFRQELRTDLTEVKKELDRVENELDAWKEKYYKLLEQNLELRKSRGSEERTE